LATEVLNRPTDANDSLQNQRQDTSNKLHTEAIHELSGGTKAANHKTDTSGSVDASNDKKSIDKSDKSDQTKETGLKTEQKKEVTITVNGKSQKYDLNQLANSGDNKGKAEYETEMLSRLTASDGKIPIDKLSIEQNGANAGKLRLNTDDGAKCYFGFTEKADGTVAARIERVEQKDGSSRDFEYKFAGDPTLATAYTDTIKTSYGNGISVTRAERIGTGDFWNQTTTNADGRTTTSRMQDVHITGDGQIYYRQVRDGVVDEMLDAVYGPSWLRASDMLATRQNFIEAAHGRLFGSDRSLEKQIDKLIYAKQHQGDGNHLPNISDDQIAAMCRSLTAMMETKQSERRGIAHHITDKQVAKVTEEAIKEHINWYDTDFQGNRGTCGENSAIMDAAHVLAPEKVLKCLASLYTTGSFKGIQLNYDRNLLAADGVNAYTNALLTWGARVMGYRDLNTGFTGTTKRDIERISEKLTGKAIPFYDPSSTTVKNFYEACRKYGGMFLITLGGGHAQFGTMRNWHGKWVAWEQNHWPRDENTHWVGGHTGRMYEGPWKIGSGTVRPM